MTTTPPTHRQTMSIRFDLEDGTSFKVTQEQLNKNLDENPDYWYPLLKFSKLVVTYVRLPKGGKNNV